MGLRKPSGWQTFTAQAYAGAGQQKKAREKMKDPNQSALGGTASVGTGMVAATTGAQQQATQQVKETSEQMAKDVSVGMVPGATQTATLYTTPIPTTPTAPNVVSGTGGDVKATAAVVTTLNNNITTIKNQINQIIKDLKNASAADAKALNDKKAELEQTLKVYQNKLTEENLGKIADQSTFETDMQDREQVLAQKGNNVGKLATLFGRRGVSDKALASQIYGKDLENIQKAAAQGLREKELAELEAGRAEEQYIERGKEIQSDIEEAAKKQSERIRGLQIGYEGLKSEGYTDQQIKDLYGDDFDKYFKTTDGKITDNVSATRAALAKTQKEQEDKLKDAELEVTRAQEVETKELNSSIDTVNQILERIGGWGHWVGEQGTKQLTPIKRRIETLISDFENEKKYFKTPEEREAALKTLKSKIEVEKTNMGNELAAFLGDTNTNFWDAAKASQELIDSGLINNISSENKQMIINRLIRELNKWSVIRNRGATEWAGNMLRTLGANMDEIAPVIGQV